MNVYARVQGDPRRVVSQLREQVRRIDSNLVVSDVRTLNDQTEYAALYGAVAVLSVPGMALGAGQGSVIRLVMREMLLVILLGIAAGAVTSLLCGRFVESQLFGVKSADPAVFVVSAAALLAASVAATLIPAWRASRIDPIRALRYQ